MVDLIPDSSEGTAPLLSVAVLIGSERERAQRAINGLGGQSAVGRIEVVMVDTRPDLPALETPPGLLCRVIAAPRAPLSEARLTAVRSSEAPVVAFVEDHAIADPGWAEEVIDAFRRRPLAALGYSFRNANPGSWVSRAGFVADYIRWSEPLGERLPSQLPCNNCAYSRDLLDGLERLETLIISDVVLQEALRAAGHELAIEPRAVVEHENCETLVSLLSANFHHCRLIAAQRVEARWMGLRSRVAFALGAALLVPWLKLARDLASLRGRPRMWPRFAAALPIVLLVHIWASLGEAIGYLDPGDAEQQFAHYELDVTRSGARGSP